MPQAMLFMSPDKYGIMKDPFQVTKELSMCKGLIVLTGMKPFSLLIERRLGACV